VRNRPETLRKSACMSSTTLQQQRRRGLQSLGPTFVGLFERYMPDPFVLAIGLTVLTAALALGIAPKGAPATIVTPWYNGIFAILAFAFQMILILATGHALTHAPAVAGGLRRLVSLARAPNQAVALTFLVAAAASLLNWGFGLVVGAILAREAARQVRVDFGWLVAAAYSGFVVWASGLPSSIALTQATHSDALNIVEKLTGALLPLGSTVFATFNWLPTLVIVLVLPIVFIAIRPADADVVAFVPEAETPPPLDTSTSPTRRIDRSPVGGLAVAIGAQAANMLQSFWALPVVAMAGIGIQRVMGCTVVTFVVTGVIYGLALLVLV